MAEQLIGAMTAEFDPAAYHDEYREALLKLIEDKVAGQETVEPVAPQPATNIVDLMAALEASVKAAVEARGATPPDLGRIEAGRRVEGSRGRERQGGCEGRRRGAGPGSGQAPQVRLAWRGLKGGLSLDATRRVPAQARLLEDRRTGRRVAAAGRPGHGRAVRGRPPPRVPASTTTCAWRWTASWRAGPFRRAPASTRTSSRIAIHVEDHPVEYFDFEGTIPTGEYGAGDAIVWDWGTYEPEAPTLDPGRSIAAGELKFRIFGQKLHGRFTLVRTRGRAAPEAGSTGGGAGEPESDRDGDPWLLIHKRDADAVTGWEPEDHRSR